MAFDRSSHERVRGLDELLAEPGARAVLTNGARFLVDGSRLARVSVTSSPLFLGRDDEGPLFLTYGEAPEMLDFRAAAAVLEPDEVALLAFAHGMNNWMARARYCGACGGVLEPRSAGYSRVCPACSQEVFPRLDPAVMILATNNDRLLLAQHAGRPTLTWSTLAGFVEPGETLEHAVARELREETGLIAGSIRYFGSQGWPLPASLMIGFEIETESDAISIDPSELLDARWFTRDELGGLATSSMISLSGQMIATWRGR
jgi:NAD+ diphosphatase